MRRRDLIAGAAVIGAAWPVARAQQSEPMHRVGVLLAFPEDYPGSRAMVRAFAEGLSHFGWQENKNIRIAYRFAAGDPALFTSDAAELVSMAPDVILASTLPAVVALRERTQTIPIVASTKPTGTPIAINARNSTVRITYSTLGFAASIGVATTRRG